MRWVQVYPKSTACSVAGFLQPSPEKLHEETVRSYADGLCLSRPVGRRVERASDLCFWPSYAAVFKNLAAIISGTAGKSLHDAIGLVQLNSTPEKTAGPWLGFGDPRPLGIP